MSCNCWGFQFTIVFDAQKKAVIQNLGGGYKESFFHEIYNVLL